MNHDEIRALVKEARYSISDFKPKTQERLIETRLCNAIETLLAREAEVLGLLSGPEGMYQDDYEKGMAVLSDEIRAILNPERKTATRKAPHDSRGWHPDDEGHG